MWLKQNREAVVMGDVNGTGGQIVEDLPEFGFSVSGLGLEGGGGIVTED